MGEPLLLPSVKTLWCGNPEALEEVIDDLQSLVIKPAFPRPGLSEPIFGESLSMVEREALIGELRAHPTRHVAQARALFSTAPSYLDEGVTALPLSIRSYAVDDGDGYCAMAGGLARVSRDLAFPKISMQHGAGSKDTWVLADGPVRQVSLSRC